ncbi:hypothetical protein [uncultured Clostridium sp.]|uniref:hypothetical protein n=1 Tax=uncultured Clostridium sp. TaxID=59620 RepID=UPI0026064570|nr:hypothetical protein [uncultured Clostridium sp.]
MFDLYNDIIEISRETDLAINTRLDKVLQMINNKGALLSVKEVIREKSDIEHLEKLLQIGRDDLTIENLVLSEKYKDEFNDEDKMFARAKISKFKKSKEIEEVEEVQETEEVE